MSVGKHLGFGPFRRPEFSFVGQGNERSGRQQALDELQAQKRYHAHTARKQYHQSKRLLQKARVLWERAWTALEALLHPWATQLPSVCGAEARFQAAHAWEGGMHVDVQQQSHATCV